MQVDAGGKSITFSPTVALPAGAGPFPAYIGFGAGTFAPPIPAATLTARGIAAITYNVSEIAGDGNALRGTGKFYDPYGNIRRRARSWPGPGAFTASSTRWCSCPTRSSPPGSR